MLLCLQVFIVTVTVGLVLVGIGVDLYSHHTGNYDIKFTDRSTVKLVSHMK